MADKGDVLKGGVGHASEEVPGGPQYGPGLLVGRVSQCSGGHCRKHDTTQPLDAGQTKARLHAASQGLQQFRFFLWTNISSVR